MRAWSKISVALFDQRWDGENERSIMGICLPATETLLNFSLTRRRDEKNTYETLKVSCLPEMRAISIASMRATRDRVWDAVIIKPGGRISLLTHGLREIKLDFNDIQGQVDKMDVDIGPNSSRYESITAVEDAATSSVTLAFADGTKMRTTIDLVPHDITTAHLFQVLAQTLPAKYCFALHHTFLEIWSSRGLATSKGIEFQCFEDALARVFKLTNQSAPQPFKNAWQALTKSTSHDRFCADPAIARLNLPHKSEIPMPSRHSTKPHKMLAPTLYALHTMGEDMRLSPHSYEDLLRLASLICRIALVIRPEWADYWKRLCPDAMAGWPTTATTGRWHLLTCMILDNSD